MGVTPLTDSLPWWANQGGPTGGPGATPQGGGAASAPAGGAPAGVGSQDWLAYLQKMFGISPQQAQGLMMQRATAAIKAAGPGPTAQPMDGRSNPGGRERLLRAAGVAATASDAAKP